FAAAADAVGSGIVASLARPGGNVTGLTFIATDLVGKQLQLLREAIPGVTRVAVLWQSGGPGALPKRTQRDLLKATEDAARALVLRKNPSRRRGGCSVGSDPATIIGAMITLLLHLLRLFPFLFGSHRHLALENLALRQQLAVYKRAIIRPPLRRTDRLFWIGLARIWTGWRQALVIVTPATVLQWQRRRLRQYWTRLSRRASGGRPQVHPEIKTLIIRMATANPLWGAPRIHGELLKLGINVAERTVSRLLPKRRPRPSQTWRTFLANNV